jgi:hypothetical protein
MSAFFALGGGKARRASGRSDGMMAGAVVLHRCGISERAKGDQRPKTKRERIVFSTSRTAVLD